MYNINNETGAENKQSLRHRPQKKITPQRLKNIGLYYLQRFETSSDNLRSVLQRRVDAYAKENPTWNKQEAYQWIENILEEFIQLHYLDDVRFAEIKINDYLRAGKSARYIQNKLRQKGISALKVETLLSEKEYNPLETALKFAERKKIGPYRSAQTRREYRQKDMGSLVRAGFDYDTVCEVLDYNFDD